VDTYEPQRGHLVHRAIDDKMSTDVTWIVVATQDTGETHHGDRIWVWIQKADDPGGSAGAIVASHELLQINY